MLISFKDKSPHIDPSVYVAKTAEIIGDIEIGENSSIWNGAVLRGDMNYIKLGKNVNVQDNAVIHGTFLKYPTIIGNNVSIGHAAIVHGCTIKNDCIIGMGAKVLEGAEIGAWCMVGAGAVITEGMKIPDGSLVLGVPAKIVKELTDEQKERITANWQSYIILKENYIKAT
jgi:carbonic anhydrase/acetyltransferase-like protein (isoleucine patch superfamily)